MECADITPQMPLFEIFTIGSIKDLAMTMPAIQHRLHYSESQQRCQVAERARELNDYTQTVYIGLLHSPRSHGPGR